MKKQKKSQIKNILLEKLYITLLYSFLFMFLGLRIKTLIGRSSGFAFQSLPILQYTDKIPGFKIFTRPESTLILYSAMMRPISSSTGLTKSLPYLVRFNLILVLLLEMLQFLFLDYWNVLFQKGPLNDSLRLKKTNLVAYSLLLSSFLGIYLYCYLVAILGKIPKFPGIFNIVTLSAQYWLRSKNIKSKQRKANR